MTEDFEVGGFFGFLSIEDLGTNPVYGARVAYHVTEDIFLEAAVGTSKADKTSYELLSGNVQLLTEDQREYTYYNLSAGFNLLPGEAFFFKFCKSFIDCRFDFIQIDIRKCSDR